MRLVIRNGATQTAPGQSRTATWAGSGCHLALRLPTGVTVTDRAHVALSQRGFAAASFPSLGGEPPPPPAPPVADRGCLRPGGSSPGAGRMGPPSTGCSARRGTSQGRFPSSHAAGPKPCPCPATARWAGAKPCPGATGKRRCQAPAAPAPGQPLSRSTHHVAQAPRHR